MTFTVRPMSKELRNLSTLDEVLIISCLDTDKLQKKLIHNVMDFGDPGRENVGEPFLPQKACIVDTNPFTNNYLFLLLMKRRDYNEIANVDIYSDDDEATPEVELIDITNDQGVEVKIQLFFVLKIRFYIFYIFRRRTASSTTSRLRALQRVTLTI